MTNQYMTAYADDPIVRAAVMQSADSKPPFRVRLSYGI